MKTLTKCILVAIGVTLTAVLGSIFSAMGMEWYGTLTRPTDWPPNYIFPIVWSIVYLLAFVTLCGVYRAENNDTRTITVLAIVNGLLNVLWCLVFFTFEQLFVGVVVIVINLVVAIWLVLQLKSKGNLWFYLMLVYPLWVSVATTLNIAMWILN